MFLNRFRSKKKSVTVHTEKEDLLEHSKSFTLEEDKEKLSLSDKLSNILLFAKYIGWDSCDKDENGLYPVHHFIKLLARRIISDRIMLMTETFHCEINAVNDVERFYSNDSFSGIEWLDYCEKIDTDVEIDLDTFPIITGVWRLERLAKAVKTYGSKEKPWEEKTANHEVNFYLPMGVVVSTQGHHSITAGDTKGVGKIHIHKGSNHKIYNMSALYDIIRFDGENYISKKTGEFITKAASFEFGCIFEIGRLLYENDVDFLGLK